MIVDAHTHFYDPSRPEGVPWPNPKDEILYRTVLPKDLRAVAVSEGVTGAIVVEASDWVEDNQWVLDLVDKDPFILGVVGNLEPGGDDFDEHLNRFAENPLFRGIRLRGKIVDDLDSPVLSAGLERLAMKGLAVDLLVRPAHLPGVASLAGLFPELHMVVNHIAGVIIDGGDPDEEWARGIRAVGEYSNVYCKVSGIASATRLIPAPTDLAFYTPVLDVLWRSFGEDRLVYGSDWPVCSRYADYPNMIRVVREYFREKGEDASEKYFWKNSKAAYGWTER